MPRVVYLPGGVYTETGARQVIVGGSIYTETLSAATIALSNPTTSNITETTATVGCDTDTTSGTLYAYVSTSATAPNTTDLKAGTGATWSDSDATPTSTTTFSVTGLSAGTDYYTYFYQEDGGDVSNVLESGIWTTTGGSVSTVPLGFHLVHRQFASVAASRLGGVLQ